MDLNIEIELFVLFVVVFFKKKLFLWHVLIPLSPFGGLVAKG